MSPRWSESEMATLRSLYPVTNSADLVPIFRRKLHSIHRMARRHGIRKEASRIRDWTPAEVETLTVRYGDTKIIDLCAMLGRTRHSIYQKAYSLGMERPVEFLKSGKLGRTGAPPKARAVFLVKAAEAMAQPMGASLADVLVTTGAPMSSARSFLFKASRDGQIFQGGAHKHTRYFLTAEAAAAGTPLIVAAAQRRRDEVYAAKLRMMREATAAAIAQRPPKPPKAAKPPKPPKVKVAKPPKPPKPPRVRLERAKPTRFNPEAPKRVNGPALLDKPADDSKAVRIVAPRTPGRFEVPSDYRGPFSMVGIGRDAMTGRAWSAA